jgi:hypothetical protein
MCRTMVINSLGMNDGTFAYVAMVMCHRTCYQGHLFILQWFYDHIKGSINLRYDHDYIFRIAHRKNHQ